MEKWYILLKNVLKEFLEISIMGLWNLYHLQFGINCARKYEIVYFLRQNTVRVVYE